jgi:hypothetical protein
MRGRKTTPTEQLAKLREAEVRARQAVREAEGEALDVRNRADRAEQAVRSAHAGKGGEVREAERALDRIEREVRFAALKVQGMNDREAEARSVADQFEAANFRDLIAEGEPAAIQAVDMMRRGLELLQQGDELWHARAQEVERHLKAAGHRAVDNISANHELAELARRAKRFDGTLTAPVPHYRAVELRAQQDRLNREQREQRTEPDKVTMG